MPRNWFYSTPIRKNFMSNEPRGVIPHFNLEIVAVDSGDWTENVSFHGRPVSSSCESPLEN